MVIGAMLIAPLMGPLLGAGFALVQGNLELMRRSVTSALLGIMLALAIATLIGAINPGFEPTMEVEARGRPDLFVAFFSGVIAAYAQCRTSLSNSLAGVAIAAALLPPLAVIGISLMLLEIEIAIFAAILLTTNLVAIVLGAASVFWLVGVQARGKAGGRPWVRSVLLTLLLLAVALTAPLMLRGLDEY